jgi:hypothetical protein
MFKELAGMFDFSSELLNRIATDILYPKTRESAYSFADLCDYEPAEADGATDTLTITLNSAMAKTLAVGYQAGGVSAATGKTVIYELTAVGNSGGTAIITVAAKQKKTLTNKLIGTILNSDDFVDYPLDGYVNIIRSSMYLTIDGDTWTRVNNFDDSEVTSRHFVLIYQSSGKVRFGFGNGVTGAKPPVGSTIYGTFEITEGFLGKMDAGEITVNIGGDPDIASLTNSGSSGGNNAESVSSIIRNARGNVRLRSMVWSQEDLETAARQSSSSVMKALGLPSVPDVGSATIQIIPSGGGNPSAGLKSSTDVYVTALTQFGVMPIVISDPSYVSASISVECSIRDDYTEVTVLNLLAFAMTLITCAFDNQVLESFDDNGIDDCRVNVINVLWPSWAFTSSENEALQFIVEKWRALLSSSGREYREWGQALEVGDIWIMGNFLGDFGVDSFNVISPVTNTTTTSTQIINTGTIEVNEES